MLVGEGVGCSGRLELEDLLVGVSMGPLLEERPHRLGGQVAPADQPLVVLLDGEHRGQADQALVVGEDADDVGAPADLAVEALKRIGRADLAPVSVGKA
jgi:hypothetical protein